MSFSDFTTDNDLLAKRLKEVLLSKAKIEFCGRNIIHLSADLTSKTTGQDGCHRTCNVFEQLKC